MDSYDSEQRRILQHFSKSTRFASFCTVLISEILQICVKFLLIFAEISQKFSKFCKNPRKSGNFCEKNCKKSAKFEIGAVQNFHRFRADFRANFSEFSVLYTARACPFRESQTACMARIDFTTLVLVGLVVAPRLCSRDPSSRKLCGPGAVAIRLPGLSPTVRERSFCYYSDVVI